MAMRILIVRACAIGDFVLNLPALRALAKLYPDARFTLVGYPATLELARLFLPVDAVHSLETQPWSGLFIAPQRELRFDAAYVWMRNVVVAENLQKSGIPLVLHAAPFPETGHAADYLLKSIGCIAPDLPDLWTPGSDRLLLHPGSGGASKVWRPTLINSSH
jgi:hypothetical protein